MAIVNVTSDLSVLSLVTNASVIVQLILLLLLLGSMMSWWYIFIKMFSIKRTISQSDAFPIASIPTGALVPLWPARSFATRVSRTGWPAHK